MKPFNLHFGIFFVAALFFSNHIHSQELTIKEVQEIEQKTEQTIRDIVKADSNQFGKTPLSTIVGIREAIKADDLATASKYLDLRFIDDINDIDGEQLIRKLVIIWSQQHVLDYSELSNEPKGHQDDGLPSYRDLLGVIETKNKEYPIYLQRVPTNSPDEGKVWKISNSTVKIIPILWNEFGFHPWAESIGNHIPSFTIFGMQNWQFISFIFILVFSWYFTAAIRMLLLHAVSYSEIYSKTMHNLINTPFRMFLYFIMLQFGVGLLGLSVSARVWIDSGTLSYLATIFLSLGIVEFIFALYVSRKHINKTIIAVLRPIVTTLKITLVIVIILNWFDDGGFDITNIVAGLGIGSLAVALAAQKSLENIFGAFTLFIARPIKPGDFCRFGNITGTVEEIGLRSTRIRTLDRVVVHVPNSVIASKDLENFSEIDFRHYYKTFRIRLDTVPEKLRQLLIAIEAVIKNHDEILELDQRVRLESIERDAFIIVVNAYVNTNVLFEFKKLEEDINLKVLDVILDHNIEMALPESTVNYK